jgi:hypothetical protein
VIGIIIAVVLVVVAAIGEAYGPKKIRRSHGR